MTVDADLVLGVDLGTSYFKLGLFDKSGALRGIGRVHVRKDSGDGSRCEIPVDRFWELLSRGLDEACSEARTTAASIRAVSYASQANSFVLLDEQMNPLTPMILWCDDRAGDMADVNNLFDKNVFMERSGMGIACSHQFCVSKLLWFQRYQPELWSCTAYMMSISDYFTYVLTEQLVGDVGTASLLGLLNIQSGTWRQDIIDLTRVQLSTPLPSGTFAGKITHEGANRLGLPSGIPFILGSLDHHMAGIGAGLGHVAGMSESTGTVLACLKVIQNFMPRLNVCTCSGLEKDQYYQLAFSSNGAGILDWYQRHHAAQCSISDLERMAEIVDIGSNGLFAQPDAELLPDFDGFRNREQHHGPGHFVRAIMESTAASLLRLMELLSNGKHPERIVATGGGAQSDLWLQIKSDLSGIEFIRTNVPEPACFGAAMLASLAVNWFPDLSAVSDAWIKINRSFKPIHNNNLKYKKWYEQWSKTENLHHS